MCLQIILGVEHQRFLVFTHEWWFLAVLTLHAGMFCPRHSEPHGPSWMDHAEESLTCTVVEDAADEKELAVVVAKGIAVSQIEKLAVDFCRQRFVVHYHSTFVLKVAEHPNIVIACEVVYLDTHVGKLREFPEEACVTLRNGISPLVPEVEHVAKKIHCCRAVLYLVKETHQSSLLLALVVNCPRAEVGVRQNIYVLSHHISLSQVLLSPPRSSYSCPIRVRRRGLP